MSRWFEADSKQERFWRRKEALSPKFFRMLRSVSEMVGSAGAIGPLPFLLSAPNFFFFLVTTLETSRREASICNAKLFCLKNRKSSFVLEHVLYFNAHAFFLFFWFPFFFFIFSFFSSFFLPSFFFSSVKEKKEKKKRKNIRT